VPESAASADLAFFRQTGLEWVPAQLMAAAAYGQTSSAPSEHWAAIHRAYQGIIRPGACTRGSSHSWDGHPNFRSSPLALLRLSPNSCNGISMPFRTTSTVEQSVALALELLDSVLVLAWKWRGRNVALLLKNRAGGTSSEWGHMLQGNPRVLSRLRRAWRVRQCPCV